MANNDLNPVAGGPQGSSALYKYGTTPNTRTVVSQKVRMMTPAYGGNGLLYQIGVCTSITVDGTSRSADPIKGVGFGDMIAELVPGPAEIGALTFSRALLYLSNHHQAFGYAGGVDGPVRSLREHRWPFDTEMQLVLSHLANAELGTDSDGVLGLKDIDFTGQNVTGASEAYANQKLKAIITYFEGCWITAMDNISADATAGGIMGQNIGAAYTDIHDLYSTYGEFMPTGNDPTLGQNGSALYVGRSNVNSTSTVTQSQTSFTSLTGAVTPPNAAGGVQLPGGAGQPLPSPIG